MTDPEEGRAWCAQRGDQYFRCFQCHLLDPPERTVPRQQPTSRARGIQAGTAGYTPHEGGPRGLDPSGWQPSIKGGGVGTPEGRYPEVWLDLGSGIKDPMP